MILLMTMGVVTAAAADPSPKSQAQISVTFSADCTDFTAGSSKDISFVEVHFSDGTVVKDESMASPQYSSGGGDLIGSVVVKSGTTEQTFTCEVVEVPPDPGLDG